MRYQSFFILLLVTVLAIGIAVYLTTQQQQSPSSLLHQPLFPELVHQANEVVSITIRDVKTTLTIKRQDIHTDQWIVHQKNYPASFDRVKTLVIGIAHLRILEERTNNPERFNRLYLQSLQNTTSKALEITLHDSQNTPIASFLLGKRIEQRQPIHQFDSFFVRKTNDHQSWLVQGNLDIDVHPLSWLNRTLPSIPEDDVKTIISQTPKEYLTFERHTPEQKTFTPTGLPENESHSSQKIQALAQIASVFSFQDVQPVEKLEFDTNNTLFITEIKTFQGLSLMIRTIQHENQSWMAFSAKPVLLGASTAQEQILNIHRYSPWAYQISSRLAEKLRIRSHDLIEEPS